MTWEQMALFTDEELGIRRSYKLIGLTGYAQSGKDTVANILVEKYGYRRVAFADKIREFLYDVNPLVACSPTGYLKDLVDLVGWDKAKQENQVRRLLQDLGVSARKVFNEDFWIQAALSDMHPSERIVVTDVRFTNEANYIERFEGQLWRVVRPGVEAVNSHISETELNGFTSDHTIVNGGTLEDLELLIKIRMNDAIAI
jgi:hypothetical protein